MLDQESQRINKPRVVVMAGGKGKRLEDVTRGKFPKDFVELHSDGTRGIDRTQTILSVLGWDDVVYTVTNFEATYRQALKNTTARVKYQPEGRNHGSDLAALIREEGFDRQYLILPTDVYYDPSDLAAMHLNHSNGTMSWGISNQDYEAMRGYKLLLTVQNELTVVGSKISPYAELDPSQHDLYTQSAIVCVDPSLYMDAYERYCREKLKDCGIGLYREVGYRIAEDNRQRHAKSQSSVLNGHIFKQAMVDYGTPAGLSTVRLLYKKVEGPLSSKQSVPANLQSSLEMPTRL